jgi:hypothetical protein
LLFLFVPTRTDLQNSLPPGPVDQSTVGTVDLAATATARPSTIQEPLLVINGK